MLYQNRTFIAQHNDESICWFEIDATGKTLGRLATEIAMLLRGKRKPTFTPHVRCGDGVIVVNAEKVAVTGNKEAQKEYYDYTGYPSGGRMMPYRRMKKEHPERIIERAVWGMLPHNRLGRSLLKRLRVNKGPKHTMQAQKPIVVNL